LDPHILDQDNLVHKSKTLKKRKEVRHFWHQEVYLSNTPIFLPEGWELPLLGLYVIFLPYFAGFVFLFFLSEMDYNIFLSLNDDLFFIMSWMVGYEIIAASILLIIAKSAVLFHLKNG
jgi:hypothetical protein